VTQEKDFSEDYLRIHRFPWGTRLDDPNELVPNFNRYVIGAICSSNAKRPLFCKHSGRTYWADKALLYEVIKAFARIDRKR